MASDYLIVHKKILPSYLEKVIQARNLLAANEARSVTDAVNIVGISRNTYYKYKDYVFLPDEQASRRRAVLTLIIKDENGSLSSVIQTLTSLRTSILTISQAIPIGKKANVLISLDITQMKCPTEELISILNKLPAVRKVYLDAVE